MTTPLHDPTAGPVPDALRVAGLTVSLPAVDRPYDGAEPILRGLSFRAPTGQVTVIVGSNGAGKTTALRAIAGAFPSDAGAVHVLGTAMGRAERALPPEAALVSDTPALPGRWTARRVATLYRKTVPVFDVRDFDGRLRTHGISPDTPIRDLSRGQATQFQLAAALTRDPRLLLLDEPLARLDPLARTTLVDELRAFMARVPEGGHSVVLTSHDLDGMDRFADHLVVNYIGAVILAAPDPPCGTGRRCATMGACEPCSTTPSAPAPW